jgi:hypothetical protein
MASSVGVIHYGASSGDWTGYSVNGANDVNTDGYADVVVGAPYGNQNTGRAYVIFGSQNPTSVLLSNMGASGYIINGESYYDYFGDSVNRADDINGDGLPDVIIGAPGASSSTGCTYIVYGQQSQSTIEVSDMLASEGMILAGGTFDQRSGWSVAAAADSENNLQVVIGTSPTLNTNTGVTPTTSIFVYVPGSAVTGLTLVPSAIPTPVPSSVPTVKPTTSEPTTSPSVSPTELPTRTPTMSPTPDPTAVPTFAPTSPPTYEPSAKPSPRPTTLWTHEKPLVLGTVIPFVTATLPLCFSRQICGVILDNYGTETIDEENNPALIIIHRHSGITKAEKPTHWISWLRHLCDVVYGADYKSEKIMHRDFTEKYMTPKMEDTNSDAEFPVGPPLMPLAAGCSDPYQKDLEMQIMDTTVISPQAVQLSINEEFQYPDNIPKEAADVEKYMTLKIEDTNSDAEFPVEPPLMPLAAGCSDPYQKDVEMQIMDTTVISPPAVQLSVNEEFQYPDDIPKETADVEIYLLHSVDFDNIPPKLLQMLSLKSITGADRSISVVPALTDHLNPPHVADHTLRSVLSMGKIFIGYYPLLAHSVGGAAHQLSNETFMVITPSKTTLFTTYVVVSHVAHLAVSDFNYHVALANTLVESTAFGSRLLTGHVVQQQYQLLGSSSHTPVEVFMYCEASILSVNAISYITVLALRSLVPFTGATVAPNTEYSFLMTTSIGATHCLAAYHTAFNYSPSALYVWLRLLVDTVVFLAMLRKSKFNFSSICSTQQTVCHLISVIYAVATVDTLVGPALSILGVSGAL